MVLMSQDYKALSRILSLFADRDVIRDPSLRAEATQLLATFLRDDGTPVPLLEQPLPVPFLRIVVRYNLTNDLVKYARFKILGPGAVRYRLELTFRSSLSRYDVELESPLGPRNL